MNIFVAALIILAVLCGVLCVFTQKIIVIKNDEKFKAFQITYIIVYMLAMAGDWLQGPYVYALYEHYNMSKHEIELLFVAGFGSSMIFGTVIGSFADKYGRKFNCLLYGIVYSVSCLTKHFNNFYILLLGRFTGGVATSILFSAFESWVICQHNKNGFDENGMKVIFSNAVLANSVIAIFCGIIAQYAVDVVGFVAPFDLAICFLLLMMGYIQARWEENYGDSNVGVMQSFQKSFSSIKLDHKILSLGVIQSLFESSMYCFVLEWTPILEQAVSNGGNSQEIVLFGSAPAAKPEVHRGKIPHGFIFAAFMVAVMIGSSLFKLLCKTTTIESFMRVVLLVSAACLAVPIIMPNATLTIFFALIVFEVCVGIFWPAMSNLRGKYVPEDIRATIMNVFRVPLNLMVVILLCQNLKPSTILSFCVISLIFSSICQQMLYRLSFRETPANENKVGEASGSPEHQRALLNEV